MIPVGYMAKKIFKKSDWPKSDQIEDIYSISNCMSNDFTDYINFWKHNGYWMFDSPEIIQQLAKEYKIDLKDTKIFFYEVYEFQYSDGASPWKLFQPEKSFPTNIQIPQNKVLEGYDIASFSTGNTPEHSYLSCNGMAATISVNKHCLLRTFEEAKSLLEKGEFKNCEPGPSRIFAVYSISDGE